MARPHPLLIPLAAGARPTAGTPDETTLASALDHGMQGLLWSWVRQDDVACGIRERLAGAALVERQRHRQHWEALAHVSAVGHDLGIDVATVKGVTAESRWYAASGERPCSDVDVLLGPDDVSRAAEFVDALNRRHPLRGELAALVSTGAIQGVNVRVDGVPIDVHFDLLKLGIPTLQRKLVWDRTVPFPLGDHTTVRVLDAETALVHLLLHLNKDSFPRLLGYADIARVLAVEEIDWQFIDRFVRTEGLEVPAYRSLAKVVRALGLPPPRPDIERGLRARLWAATWPDRAALLGSAGTHRSRRQDVLPLVARGRAADSLRWLRQIVFPPSLTVAVRYPDLPGPYLWRLAQGRWRTARNRRRAFRARLTPDAAARTPPTVTAAVLRKAAVARPLWLDVRGASMGRSIRDGWRVRVELADRPRQAEVWAFCDRAGNIIVHRCVEVADGTYRFQGDARAR